ncbi:hypothetical protein V8B97DRAFT_1649565 [Scleroderma yunnanense]
MLPLILYDIPSNIEGNYWSPNTVKSRFILAHKGLPFEVDWVEFPDIAPRMKEIGATPNKFPDGSERYTLPVLRDPNTGAIITDSWDIAVYLENTYPEKPIFPKDSQGLIRAFEAAYINQVMPAIKFLLLRAREIMNEPSVEYYTTTKEEHFKQKFEEFSPEGPERDQHWSVLEKGFTTIKTWYDNTDGKWLMGSTFSYADILAGSGLFWFKRVLHDDEWKRVAAWHDGHWKRLLADVERECKVAQ